MVKTDHNSSREISTLFTKDAIEFDNIIIGRLYRKHYEVGKMSGKKKQMDSTGGRLTRVCVSRPLSPTFSRPDRAVLAL